MSRQPTDFTLTVVLEEQSDNQENWAPLHQSLLMLFDSPLNHAGMLEVYISLASGKLIKTHKEIRIPRTFKRFNQLLCNFLDGCSMPVVQTNSGPAKLMQFVARSSFEKLVKQKQFQTSNSATSGEQTIVHYTIANFAPKLRSPSHFTNDIDQRKQVVLFLEFGPVDFNALGCGRETEYEVKTINKYPNRESFSVSRYPLSASLTCVKLVSAFEEALLGSS